MAKASVNQKFLIKKETTPGTANVTAMQQFTAMGGRPEWITETNEIRAQGFKMPSTIQQTAESGDWEFDGVQDYNHIGHILASRFALPVTTTPAGGTLSRQHVFTIDPDGADTFATYTCQYGDTSLAVQTTYSVFNSLGLNIQRQSLSLDTAMISRTPSIISSVATVGVVTVPSMPTAAREFNIWADSTWAGLGTTQLTAAYEGNIDLGDKFVMDTPINSAITSFESLVEADDQTYDGTLQVGFDAVAQGLVNTFTSGALKFIRIKSATASFIEAAIPYSLQLDFCIRIRKPGRLGAISNGVLALPFDFAIVPDPTTGNALTATLVNTILTY